MFLPCKFAFYMQKIYEKNKMMGVFRFSFLLQSYEWWGTIFAFFANKKDSDAVFVLILLLLQ